VTVFGYAQVPWMKRHQRMIDDDALPDAGARMAQSEVAADSLVSHGYRRIGMDHFARPDDPMVQALDDGRLHRNFQGYTTDDATALIGIGVSSISALPAGYAQNTDDLKQYRDHIEAGRLPVARGIALSDHDRLRRAIIERLMCDYAVDLSAQRARYAMPFTAIADAYDTLSELVDDGLIEVAGEQIRVTPAGRPFIRSIAARFDAYLQPDGSRHARAI
jgi:oxygen-independent coproporphyrinogen-3 oxidase